jgi:hypothetical protein
MSHIHGVRLSEGDFFVISFNLQYVEAHLENCVIIYTMDVREGTVALCVTARLQACGGLWN